MLFVNPIVGLVICHANVISEIAGAGRPDAGLRLQSGPGPQFGA